MQKIVTKRKEFYIYCVLSVFLFTRGKCFDKTLPVSKEVTVCVHTANDRERKKERVEVSFVILLF